MFAEKTKLLDDVWHQAFITCQTREFALEFFVTGVDPRSPSHEFGYCEFRIDLHRFAQCDFAPVQSAYLYAMLSPIPQLPWDFEVERQSPVAQSRLLQVRAMAVSHAFTDTLVVHK